MDIIEIEYVLYRAVTNLVVRNAILEWQVAIIFLGALQYWEESMPQLNGN